MTPAKVSDFSTSEVDGAKLPTHMSSDSRTPVPSSPSSIGSFLVPGGARVGDLTQAFVDIVRDFGDEDLEETVEKFCDEALVTVNAKELLIDLAPKIKHFEGQRLVRIGIGVRMSLSIVLTYMDFITDFLVLKEYGEGGEETRVFYHTSLTILATSTLCNVIVALALGKKKGMRARCKAVIVALLQLNPIVHASNVWMGNETR